MRIPETAIITLDININDWITKESQEAILKLSKSEDSLHRYLFVAIEDCLEDVMFDEINIKLND